MNKINSLNSYISIKTNKYVYYKTGGEAIYTLLKSLNLKEM